MVRRRRTFEIVVALAIGLALGCADGRQRETTTPEPPRGTLLAFATPGGTVSVPPEFERANGVFEKARVDYERNHRFLRAARGFLEAAKILLPVRGHYSDTAIGDRRICYENAASGFSAASAFAEGERELSAAMASDPTCADTLRPLIRRMEEGASVAPKKSATD